MSELQKRCQTSTNNCNKISAKRRQNFSWLKSKLITISAIFGIVALAAIFSGFSGSAAGSANLHGVEFSVTWSQVGH
jgi:hypothetical protein